MGLVTVRVVPRSSRPGVEAVEDAVVVRVRAAPEAGRATAEAARTLAARLGVPSSTVTLRSGPSSRTKVFEVATLGGREILERLRAP